MRKWKRVDTGDGARFRSALAAHEASMLHSLVTSMLDMLEDRQSSAPTDELEQITGIKAGNPKRPQDATMRRLLPDFYRSERNHPAEYGRQCCVPAVRACSVLAASRARSTPASDRARGTIPT